MGLTESHRHQVEMAQTRVARAYEEVTEVYATNKQGNVAKAAQCTALVQAVLAWAAAYATVPAEDGNSTRRLTVKEECEAAGFLAFIAGTALSSGWGLAEFLFECVACMEPGEG